MAFVFLGPVYLVQNIIFYVHLFICKLQDFIYINGRIISHSSCVTHFHYPLSIERHLGYFVENKKVFLFRDCEGRYGEQKQDTSDMEGAGGKISMEDVIEKREKSMQRRER